MSRKRHRVANTTERTATNQARQYTIYFAFQLQTRSEDFDGCIESKYFELFKTNLVLSEEKVYKKNRLIKSVYI